VYLIGPYASGQSDPRQERYGFQPPQECCYGSRSSARLGRSIAWSISPFDTSKPFTRSKTVCTRLTAVTVPVFDAIGKTFPLNNETLHNLARTAGLDRFKGEIPSGLMVLVGYTGSWWHQMKAENLRLGFNLNWVVVLGIPK
jgi:hypothetical protein